MLNLSHKSVAITGAFGTLGAATARAACELGAAVSLIDFAPTQPPGSIEACGKKAFALPGVDLSKPDAALKAVQAAHDRMGGLDVLINIAGTFSWQLIADGEPSVWDKLFSINLKTALNASVAAIPYLRQSKSGRIINVGANAALKAGNGMGPYAASKSAVHRLTESLADELKSSGITVNAVLPSIIDTPVNRRDMPSADFSTWVTPQALADVILFLASDAARAVTGALIPVTGKV